MAHIVHCRICKLNIDISKEENWVMPSKNWYYHDSCYNDFKAKMGKIEECDMGLDVDDKTWYTATVNYLQNTLKIVVDFIKTTSQWNNLLKKGRTAKGIYYTLRYVYDIKKMNKEQSANGIGIVGLMYDEAVQYWGETFLKDREKCEKIEREILKELNRKTVYILQKTKKKEEKVDLSAIALMEDDE